MSRHTAFFGFDIPFVPVLLGDYWEQRMALLPLYSKDGNTSKMGGALGPAGGEHLPFKK